MNRELIFSLLKALNGVMEVEKDGVITIWVWDYYQNTARKRDKMTKSEHLKSEIYRLNPDQIDPT